MIVAKINGYEITDLELDAQIKALLNKSHLLEATEKIRKNALEHLVEGYLLLQAAMNSNIQISQDEIDDKLIELMLKYRTDQDFKKMLSANDLNIKKIREKIRRDLMINRYYEQQFPPTVEISEKKLKDIYKENIKSFHTREMVKAYHILIKGTDEHSKREIQKIRERITTPENFKNEAKQCSECPSCCNGGNLGYIMRGKMVKGFDEVAFNLEVNEISGPVKTEFGYHIIMITDKKAETTAEFDAVKKTLATRLQQIDRELKLIRHLRKLRAKAKIEFMQDTL